MGAVNMVSGALWHTFLFVLRRHAIEGADEASAPQQKAPAKPATIILSSPSSASAVGESLLSR
jgi:hypothetical protein